MLSCRQASMLLSQKQERQLTLKEKVDLKFHLAMCSGCRQLNKQFSSLRNIIRESNENKK